MSEKEQNGPSFYIQLKDRNGFDFFQECTEDYKPLVIKMVSSCGCEKIFKLDHESTGSPNEISCRLYKHGYPVKCDITLRFYMETKRANYTKPGEIL